MAEQGSPRVNAVHLPNYIGRIVRLIGKVISVDGDTAIIQSADGQQIEVRLINGEMITSKIVEIIGTVVDPTKMKMMAAIPLSDNTSLKVAADVATLWHEPRFSNVV